MVCMLFNLYYRRTCLSKSKGRPKPPVEAETYQKLYRWVLPWHFKSRTSDLPINMKALAVYWERLLEIEMSLKIPPNYYLLLISFEDKSCYFLLSRFFERHNQIFFSLINKFDFDWTYKPKLPVPALSSIGTGDTWGANLICGWWKRNRYIFV